MSTVVSHEIVVVQRNLISGFPRGFFHTTPDEFDNGVFTLKTRQMFSLHTTPDEFENGVFTLKTRQMFSVLTTPEKFVNATTAGYFGFVFEETLFMELITYYRDVIIFEKLSFSIAFRLH